jgi:hypothetical protein
VKLKKLIKKINKENAPPGGWSLRDKVTSSRRGGPAHKESGFKPSSSQAWQGPGFPDSCNNLFDREVE